MKAKHYDSCAAFKDAAETCTCEALEDQTIAMASRPSPAELIRLARSKGLLKPAGHAYF